jgi:hypothetical protein
MRRQTSSGGSQKRAQSFGRDLDALHEIRAVTSENGTVIGLIRAQT